MKNKTFVFSLFLSIGFSLKVDNCYSQWFTQSIVSANDLFNSIFKGERMCALFSLFSAQKHIIFFTVLSLTDIEY